MEEVNERMEDYDVVLVVGANDVSASGDIRYREAATESLQVRTEERGLCGCVWVFVCVCSPACAAQHV